MFCAIYGARTKKASLCHNEGNIWRTIQRTMRAEHPHSTPSIVLESERKCLIGRRRRCQSSLLKGALLWTKGFECNGLFSPTIQTGTLELVRLSSTVAGNRWRKCRMSHVDFALLRVLSSRSFSSFWAFGYCCTSMRFTRGEKPSHSSPP